MIEGTTDGTCVLVAWFLVYDCVEYFDVVDDNLGRDVVVIMYAGRGAAVSDIGMNFDTFTGGNLY